ncbi:SIR2 family protein [Bradyrhizobium pachyrhizi]|uniref:SIR2 family protein n=1 Tax=Bradyrhizobium pachyrhizi TaxID=280333 RepID=UPI0024B06295|nr:SIR2 family protein [Bradyrhizobium pachyrhizi]WFU53617.1 SIR2 family protein [Bradyrhizobium pachyrhizi]
MPISTNQLVESIDPTRTVLFFGSGSSIPSKAPSAQALVNHLAKKFSLPTTGFNLSEVASLAEQKHSRAEVIAVIRDLFRGLKPTGGLLNLPLYKWRSLFTTNYDDLIEQCYARRSLPIVPISSNFDFGLDPNPAAIKLYKLHGTIEKDISDGNKSRIILSETDYDQTIDYREFLYDRLKGDLAGSRLIIIGHSLNDADIRDVVNRAAAINAKAENGGQIVLLLYTEDHDRAVLFERRGISVCFAGIDEFFAALTHRHFGDADGRDTSDPLDGHPALQPVTIDVAHASDAKRADASAMFNGWPATHADILGGLTFERTVAGTVMDHLNSENALVAIILGASGVGKTTAARQVLQRLRQAGTLCWEHKPDLPLLPEQWAAVAEQLREQGKVGALLIDDAHSQLYPLNELVDRLFANDNGHLKIILTTTRHQWNPRVKSPTLYRNGKEFALVRLSNEEIERLLQLIDISEPLRRLVEPMFSGFSRPERRRRLIDRCEADMFVCLKNIFASESFDDIILREYADLVPELQDVYRYVAAMETAGVRIHRQLLIRILRIPAQTIAAALDRLTDIVSEYDIEPKDGIFGWRTRHPVIAAIVTRFKFSDIAKVIDLFDLVIDNLSPTYDIEIRTIRELCNVDTGIPRLPEKDVQNRLYRKLMSLAPSERVPRHRLIRNLIGAGAYEKAETEIRIFEKDFGADGPVYRYKVQLLLARAVRVPGILPEDRLQILDSAREMALLGISRFPLNKTLLTAYADVGVEYYRRTSSYAYFDEAIEMLKNAEERLGDPDVSRIISRYVRRIQGQVSESSMDEDDD